MAGEFFLKCGSDIITPLLKISPCTLSVLCSWLIFSPGHWSFACLAVSSITLSEGGQGWVVGTQGSPPPYQSHSMHCFLWCSHANLPSIPQKPSLTAESSHILFSLQDHYPFEASPSKCFFLILYLLPPESVP